MKEAGSMQHVQHRTGLLLSQVDPEEDGHMEARA
jgi:hypothetical protein